MSGSRTSSFVSSLDVISNMQQLSANQRSLDRKRASSISSSSTCTLGRYDNRGFDDIPAEEVVDLTIDDIPCSRQAFKEGEHALTSFRLRGEVISPGDALEVTGMAIGDYPVNLVRVSVIARARIGEVLIRGDPFTRCRELKGKLPKRHSEVCRIWHLDQSNEDDSSAAVVDVSLDSIVKKRKLITTNTIWPRHACADFAHMEDAEARRLAIENCGTLVHRWNFKIFCVTQGRKSKPFEEVLERVYVEEVIRAEYRETDERLCAQWRGGRILGGSWNPGNPKQPTVEFIDLDSHTKHIHVPQWLSSGRTYTVFDSFSGAGGASCGAQMAGFKVTHAVDKASDVWSTYRANFPQTSLFRGAIDEFIRSHRGHLRVDVLHLSPPCQFFSPAHTHEGCNDEANIDSLFSGNSLINKTRPRIISVEQTFGITHDRHEQYFHMLINDFTQLGYSVRWRVVRLCTWGSAQDRKRLIMLAAAPGERLPPFPHPTHSENGIGGLKPYMTIRKALRGISPWDALHDVRSVKRHSPRKAPYDADRLAGTLTTGGADWPYPDGTRDFTLRELASLQGFPVTYQFEGNRTSIKRQIGNAFPPNTVHVLFKHLRRWLLKQDGFPSQDLPSAHKTSTAQIDERIFAQVVEISDSIGPHSRRDSSDSDISLPDMIDLVELDDDQMDLDEPRAGRPPVGHVGERIMIDLT